MKNTIACLALLFALAGCSDNASSDDSQNNTSSSLPKPDSAAHANDSSSPSIENTGAANPNTVNSVGNQSAGAGTSPAGAKNSAHPNGVSDGTAPSRDTMNMSKGKKK